MSKAKQTETTPDATTPATENFTMEKKSSGWRHCEKCGGNTKGTRSSKCLNPNGCGHVFQKKEKTPATNSKTNDATPAFTLSDALTKLDKIKTFVASHGGKVEATKAIDEIKALMDDCGGIDEIKTAMETLAKWQGK